MNNHKEKGISNAEASRVETIESKEELRNSHMDFGKEFHQEQLRVRRVVQKEIERARLRRRDDEDEYCPICQKEHIELKFARNKRRGNFLICCGKECCAECSEKCNISAPLNTCPLCKSSLSDGKHKEDLVHRHAENGRGWALATLMYAYRDGTLGLKTDKKMALKYCRQAAEKGDADCQHLLARGYFCGYIYGLSVTKSWESIVLLARSAAEKGHSQSQYFLGILYQNGSGVPGNIDEAMRWMTLSASQGFSDAALWLGLYYSTLQHKMFVFPFHLAFYWFGKAAEFGNPKGHFHLAKALQFSYHHSDNVKQSGLKVITSLIWLYQKARMNALRELESLSETDSRYHLYTNILQVSERECQSLMKAYKGQSYHQECNIYWIESFFKHLRK
jgi:TPR repeat protein